MTTLAITYLADVAARFRALRESAEKAVAQVDDAALLATLGAAEDNSIAVLMQHVGGNLRSRFTDFLTSDGEKPDRNRDGEFETRPGTTRAGVERVWRAGWDALDAALGALGPDDLLRTVHVRGEPMTVVQALGRQLAHHASHVGQIVLLAKHFAGDSWRTLSIPRGGSAAFNATMGHEPGRG